MHAIHEAEPLAREQGEKTKRHVIEEIDKPGTIGPEFREDRAEVGAAIEESELDAHPDDLRTFRLVAERKRHAHDGDMGLLNETDVPIVSGEGEKRVVVIEQVEGFLRTIPESRYVLHENIPVQTATIRESHLHGLAQLRDSVVAHQKESRPWPVKTSTDRESRDENW